MPLWLRPEIQTLLRHSHLTPIVRNSAAFPSFVTNPLAA